MSQRKIKEGMGWANSSRFYLGCLCGKMFALWFIQRFDISSVQLLSWNNGVGQQWLLTWSGYCDTVNLVYKMFQYELSSCHYYKKNAPYSMNLTGEKYVAMLSTMMGIYLWYQIGVLCWSFIDQDVEVLTSEWSTQRWRLHLQRGSVIVIALLRSPPQSIHYI